MPYYAFKRQLEASRSYNCNDSLSKIAVPTLILHGKKDAVAPYYLAEELHAGIKGSKIIDFDGGHTFSFRENERYARAIIDFLTGLN
jgi:pimeloyl-ACP methyl ester carboxylesterase